MVVLEYDIHNCNIWTILTVIAYMSSDLHLPLHFCHPLYIYVHFVIVYFNLFLYFCYIVLVTLRVHGYLSMNKMFFQWKFFYIFNLMLLFSYFNNKRSNIFLWIIIYRRKKNAKYKKRSQSTYLSTCCLFTAAASTGYYSSYKYNKVNLLYSLTATCANWILNCL